MPPLITKEANGVPNKFLNLIALHKNGYIYFLKSRKAKPLRGEGTMGKTKFKIAFVTLIFSTVFLLAVCGDTGVGPSSASKYTVTYNGNGNTGGSVPSDPTTYQQGGTATVLGNTGSLVKTGYSFNGWNTTAYGSGTTYTTGQTFTMGASNITLYAKWTSNIASGNTMTYNGNGGAGSVPVDSNHYYAGQTVTVLGNSGGLTYTGYSFVGWQTKADGSGTTYAAGKTFTMGAANDTLYALWAGGYAYTANNEQGYGGSISQYTIGPNGALTPMSSPTVPTGGNDPRYIAADPLGKYIYVSNITSNTVSQFAIGPDGSLAAMSTPTVLMGDVTGGKLYYPSGIAVNPASQYAYVALLEKGNVNQYSIGADGKLSALTPPTVSSDTINASNSPVAIAIDPSGKWAYVADGSNLTVSQYAIGADGTLSALTPFLVSTGGKTGSGTAFDIKIASTSSGAYVYVANYADGTVAQFKIGADGTLSALNPFLVTAGTYALTIAVHPTGKFAYVAMMNSSDATAAIAVVAQFTIDQGTGELLAMTPPTVSAGGAGAASIAVEASGKYAYATSGDSGWGSYSVAQYTIDQSTGALTLMKNATVPAGYGPGGIVTVGK
jgi:uncharacterized repeat protein (TIGR02543 family)